MRKFAVPVSWFSEGVYIIEAESKEEAIKKAEEMQDLPDTGSIDGFEIFEDGVVELS